MTDDRGYETLAALLPQAREGMINVFAAAERCTGLIDADPSWRAQTATAMVCGDLRIVPTLALPSGLSLRSVRRLAGDAPDGVSLEDAAAAAMRADSRIDSKPEAFAAYLRALPAAIRLFAAVDRDGTVRATSGSGVFGMEASVMFVNTDPDWRGRGIARAMTSAALRVARDSGAQRACLDATGAGLRIYQRLEFEAVTRTTRFSTSAS